MNVIKHKLINAVPAAAVVVAEVTCPHPERNLPAARITTIYEVLNGEPHRHVLGPGNDQVVYDDSRAVTLVSRVWLHVAPEADYVGRWEIECHLCGRGPRYSTSIPARLSINAANLTRLAEKLQVNGVKTISLPALRRAMTA